MSKPSRNTIGLRRVLKAKREDRAARRQGAEEFKLRAKMALADQFRLGGSVDHNAAIQLAIRTIAALPLEEDNDA